MFQKDRYHHGRFSVNETSLMCHQSLTDSLSATDQTVQSTVYIIRDGHWTCSLFRTLNKSWTKWTNEQWTPHFWPSEHMNMNTFFLSVFRTHEHEHANFYVVQLLFKLFWTKVEHWTLCSEHCSQVVYYHLSVIIYHTSQTFFTYNTDQHVMRLWFCNSRAHS